MFKSLKKVQQGFTIIELLIVIAIIAILAGLVLNNFQGAQAKARDTQRVTDVNNIHSKLEEYHNENGFYPETIAAGSITTLFPGIDAESAVDPRGTDIASQTAVANAAALNGTSPGTGTTANYHFTAYGCTSGECTGYQLKTGIERPSATTPDPYIKLGLNNN
jgi:prepilin-type N-terminal cleavage/methylation domain-containing protein